MVTSSNSALFACLSAWTGLTDLVEDRIRAGEAKQGEKRDMLVFQVVGGRTTTTHGEGNGTDGRLDQPFYQLTAIAATQKRCDAILWQARLALEASTTLAAVMLSPPQGLERDDDSDCHGLMQDWQISHRPDTVSGGGGGPDTELLHILVTGQSNAVGVFATPIFTADAIAGGRMFAGGMKPGAVGLGSLVDLQEEEVTTNGETGMASLVRWLRAHGPSGKLYLVSNVGMDSAPYDALKKDTTPYNHHLAQVAAGKVAAEALGLTYRVLCVIAIHGEFDEAANNAAYKDDLATWQSDYETDVKALSGQAEDVPMFHAAQGTAGARQYNSSNYNASSAIQLFQAHFLNPGKVVLASPETFLDFYSLPHFTAASHAWLGEQLAKVVKQVCFDALPFDPIYPSGAAIVGNTIVLDLVVPVPPVRLDYLFNAFTDSAGFRFESSNGTIFPTSVAVTGASQLTLTFGSAPGGTAKRLAYAAENALPKTNRGSNVADSDATTSEAGFVLSNFMPSWYYDLA